MTTPRHGVRTASELRQITRAQRRKMQKLADRVDRVTQADRLFFERRPDRQHRVRLASEVQQNEQLEGARLAIPPGFEIGDVR